MRRLVMGSIFISAALFGSVSIVGGQTDPVTPPVQVRATPGKLTNMIDDIDVPWEILEYIQMKYEGHAVTKADKVRRGTTELYRLRVDRDDVSTDYDSIAALFDLNWKLVGEEKYQAPPPKPTPEVEEPTENIDTETRTEPSQAIQKPDPKDKEKPDEEPNEEDSEKPPADNTPRSRN